MDWGNAVDAEWVILKTVTDAGILEGHLDEWVELLKLEWASVTLVCMAW
jgi:hypothetical protein